MTIPLKNGISRFPATNNQTTGIAQIHVADGGENQIVIVPGANNDLSIEDVANSRTTIDQAKVLVCQIETPLKSSFAAMRGFKGTSILNASPVPAENNLEIYTLPTILCVNELEAAAMTNRRVPNIEEAKRALTNFLDLGCRNVVITLGKNGALFGSTGGKVAHVKAPLNVTAVDTTVRSGALIFGACVLNWRIVHRVPAMRSWAPSPTTRPSSRTFRWCRRSAPPA